MRRWSIAALVAIAILLTVAAVHSLRLLQLDQDLLAAVRRDDAANVERLLGQGASANAGVRHGDVQPLEALVRKLIRLRADDTDSEPALILALTFHQVPGDPSRWDFSPTTIDKKIVMVRLLLAYKADPNACDHNGQLALTCAMPAMGYTTELTRLLVSGGANTNLEDFFLSNSMTGHVPSPFRAAVQDGWDTRLLKLMLDCGASVSAADEYGQTSLMVCHDPKIMALMLSHHPDVNQPNAFGLTALDVVAEPYWKRFDSSVASESDLAEVRRMLVRAGGRHGKRHPFLSNKRRFQ